MKKILGRVGVSRGWWLAGVFALGYALSGSSAQAAWVGVQNLDCLKGTDLLGREEVYLLATYSRNFPPGIGADSGTQRFPAPQGHYSLHCGNTAGVQLLPLMAELPPVGGHTFLALTVAEDDNEGAGAGIHASAELARSLRYLQFSQVMDPYRPFIEQLDRGYVAALLGDPWRKLGSDDYLGTVLVEFFTDPWGRPRVAWSGGSASVDLTNGQLPHFQLTGSGSLYRLILTFGL